MLASTLISIHELTIDIGGIPILVRTDSADFAHMLEDRYGEFVNADAPHAEVELEIRLIEQRDGTRDTGDGTRDAGDGLGVGGWGLGARENSLEPNPQHLASSSSGAETRENSPAPNLASSPQPPVPSPQPPAPDLDDYDHDLSVRREAGRWVMERGDFRAEWDPECQRGWVRQTANPYGIDGVLRILHSLILARQGGLLVHAASVVRNGRAFVFAGVSGAGKTTIARLAPPDVTLLTDEISYLRPESQDTGYGTENTGHGIRDTGNATENTGHGIRDTGNARQHTGEVPGNREQKTGNRESLAPNPESLIPYPVSRIPYPVSRIPYPVSRIPAFTAYGTPFAGELARLGEKVRAPLAALFLLKQGPENRIEPLSEAEAARELLRHVLFFAQDEELVGMVFHTVCDFVRRVPVRRLVFTKDASVWELIGIDD